jgi:hypothetical protein
MAWQVFGADVPRFVLPEGRLLIEGQRTNSVRNPRAEGRVEGTPGTAPTHWAVTATSTGLTRTILSQETIGGVLYTRVQYAGTATASGQLLANFDGPNVVAATPDEVWTQSAFVALTVNAGAVPVVKMSTRETQADGVTNNTPDSAAPDLPLTTVPARYTRTTTMAAATAFVQPGLRIQLTNGAAYDFVLTIGLPQLELGPFASTPILPPVGTPGAATRGTDILTAPLSALGIADNGACAVLWRGVFSATNIGTQQAIASVEDGSNNRYEIRLGAAGIPEIIRVTASTPSFANFGGVAPTPGDTIRAGMSIDGAGRLAGVFVGYNSGAALAVTGGPTSGLTTFRHGTSQTGAARAMWGETHTLTVLPRVLSDAELQAAVAAL